MTIWILLRDLMRPKCQAKMICFSQLTQDAITDEQYCYATKVLGTFNLQTMGDYYGLYLKSDILLLTDFLRILEVHVCSITN